MSQVLEGALDGKGLRVGLVATRFNELVTERLVAGARDCLRRHGVADDDLVTVRVPGSWELPLAVRQLAASGRVDAVVALGALVRGETPHFDVICAQMARGLAEAMLSAGVPVGLGVLTTDTVEQALDRAGSKLGNKGWDAALAAVEMANLLRRMRE